MSQAGAAAGQGCSRCVGDLQQLAAQPDIVQLFASLEQDRHTTISDMLIVATYCDGLQVGAIGSQCVHGPADRCHHWKRQQIKPTTLQPLQLYRSFQHVAV